MHFALRIVNAILPLKTCYGVHDRFKPTELTTGRGLTAGFEDASTAVKEFAGTYSTYMGHENGKPAREERGCGEYAKAFGVF